MKNKKLDSVIYISIPEEMNRTIGSLQIDPSILLPVELPEGMDAASWSNADLSWEMLISGMLKVLAYDPDHKDLPYFRDFVLAARPEIKAELTQSAIIKAQTGDYDLAEEIFLALEGLDPSDLRNRLNLVLLYENKANNSRYASDTEIIKARIEKLYAELLENAEDLPDIYFNAAWFFYNRQDFQRAFELCSSYLVLGSDETKRSEAEKLKRECSELKETDKEYRDAYKMISDDRNEEGLALISTFLEHNDSIWNAWFLKGWALRKMERFDEALESFEKAASLKPGHIDILNELSICCLETQQYGKSRSYLEEALVIDPENLKIISNMGILCLKEGKKEEAASFFRTVIALDPEDLLAAEYLNFLEESADSP